MFFSAMYRPIDYVDTAKLGGVKQEWVGKTSYIKCVISN